MKANITLMTSQMRAPKLSLMAVRVIFLVDHRQRQQVQITGGDGGHPEPGKDSADDAFIAGQDQHQHHQRRVHRKPQGQRPGPQGLSGPPGTPTGHTA